MLRDNGTFRYYQPGRPDMETYFSAIAAHSSIELDGQEPMQKFSRFQRFPFTKAHVASFSDNALTCVFEGYRGSPWKTDWRRTTIALGHGAWLVVDELTGAGEHSATIRWQLADLGYEFDEAANTATLDIDGRPYSVHVHSDVPAARSGVHRAVDEPGRILGWASTTYGSKHPIPVLETTYRYNDAIQIVTVIGPGKAAKILSSRGDRVDIELEGQSISVDLTNSTVEHPG